MAKINISISDELLERIDFYAKENYITRSGCIAIGMAEFLTNHELLSVAKKMGLTIFDLPVELQCKYASTDELLTIWEHPLKFRDVTPNIFDSHDARMILAELEKRCPEDFARWQKDFDADKTDTDSLRDYLIGRDMRLLIL